MKAHFATSILTHFRSYKLSAILTAFVVIGLSSAGFMIVSGRAAELRFHWPSSLPSLQNQGARGNSLGFSSSSRLLSAPLPALLCVNPGGTGGCFATIQGAVNAAGNGDTINVAAGTYDEDVSIPVDNLSLLGAGAGTTNIRGIIGGGGATVQIAANNVTVAGFTITRLGNNTTDWNNAGLNSVGIAIQGLSITNALIRDNILTGNRNGIDINNSNGHTIRNNVIDFNRTGIIFRNQTDQMTVVENFVTNNWTVGILFLDASGGTNVPVQSALNSTFSNNNLSANWYGQIVDRQSGGSLPVPGTTNLKKFTGNWFGTTSPVVTTANSAEPGYAAQIPVAYGGTATPPGGQPDIAGPASANFQYTPFLLSGTDTNIETTPGRGTNGFQGVAVVVSPAGGSATAADNDYTRINNAVQGAFTGETIKLLGAFDWTEANAAASWAKGSDGVAATADDYSILVPANLNNVKFTADNLGDASIQGPGDLAAVNLEGVLVFDGGDNQNWTISNIRFLDFDLSIGMFNGAGGSDAFNNTLITNNYILMARDLNTVVAPADSNQNIGIHFSFGTNQVISGNTIEIPGDAISSGANFASDVGMQSNTSGGSVYEGLQITNNIVRVLNAQNAANPENILGIWENAHAHTSNITVSGNQFINQAAGNNPAINLQRGFRVTSHSSATTTVTYQNNTVMGANIGFQWISGSNFSANQPVRLTSNTITGNSTGVLVQSQGLANLSFNRIVGNTVTGLNNAVGTVTAENNWWGCNAGPGGVGCDTVTGVADSNPWIVLGVSASPNPIPPGGNSTITADMTHNSDGPVPVGILPNMPVGWTATNGTMAPTSGTVTAGTAMSTFTSTSTNNGSACATVDNQLTCVTVLLTTVTITPAGGGATAADNDYTRINNAVQAAANGQTIKLVGTFNWTEPNAALSWSKGSDGVAATADDYSVAVPANLNNVTFTADNLGDAAIQGPGDLPAVDLEGVLVFNGGDNQNWTISKIRFLDFDLSIGMFNGAGGSDAFNNTHITNNYIRIARDLNATAAPGDSFQNIGIHYSFGMNQLISGNTIEIQGDAVSSGSNFASDVGMQSNTSGGGVYEGLQITNNIIRVLNAQDATNPQVILGIWENAHAHLSNITVSGNQFINQAAGNNPAINLQRGFRVTSHSSATTTVTYQNNTVMGANIGFQWISGSNFSANQPVRLISNTITGNGTGVLVQSQGLATLSFNRIVGNTVTGLNNAVGTVTAENNWWGCNAGPGGLGCDTVIGVADFNPWLVLGVSASPTSVPPGGSSTLTADMRFNSDGVNTSGSGTLPPTPVSFSATQGTMSPTSGTITAGLANSMFTSNSASSGTACATVDNQLLCAAITVSSVSFSIDDVTHNEGNAGTTSYTFTITKTGTTAINASVDYATVDGSATSPSDFTAITTTNLVFLPSETSKQVTVFVNGDLTVEPDEAFTVHLSNPSGAAISDADGTGTITNDDSTGSVTFSIDDVTHNEGNAGTTAYTFTITKSGSTALNASVDYATVNGTATAPSDFTAIGTTNLVFLPSETSKQVTVFVNGDTTVEPTEAFTVHLSNPSGASISDADGTGTITNDDSSANLSLTKVDSPDPVTASNNLTYTITVTNGGGDSAQNLQLSDTLPANTTFVSFTVPAGWTRTDVVPVGGTGTVTATAATLANGASAQFTLVVNVNASTPNNTVLSNTASVTTATSDPDLSNNSSTTTTTVGSLPDLTITKSHSGNFSGGQVGASYVITVSNIGTGVTNGLVTVTDNVPVGLTPTGPNGVVNGWTCSLSGQTVTCTRSDALPGGSSYPPINLTVNVANPAPVNVTNTATVSGGGEANTGNNTTSDPTAINCNQDFGLNNSNPLMISRFRMNGPAGPQDEYVEIFNPSTTPHTVASGICGGSGGYGLYASAGNGTTSNTATLVCYIPNGTVIPAGGYYLCTGVTYSLNNLGLNGGTAGATATGDAPIGCGGTCGANIADDAGLVLMNQAVGSVAPPPAGGFNGLLDPGLIIYDKLGFEPYGASAPAPTYPSLAATYCEGSSCLKPVGDASTGAACANPSGVFPVFPASPACYGLAGQYGFVRRQTTFDFNLGTLHQDTNSSGNDFLMVTPNPANDMGVAITGVLGVSGVLGASGPYNTNAPPDVPAVKLTRTPFDGTNQQGPLNLERRYIPDPTIANPANNPLGTLILRYRYTNNSGVPINGLRFQVDNLSTLCGPQTTLTVATGDARNVGSSPTCGTGSFTAIFKALNSPSQVVVDSSSTARFVNGTVMEDLSVGGAPGAGPLSPNGGGIDNTFIINPSSANASVGDGVTGGVGTFATTVGTTDPARVIRVQVKFGVVKNGRFILLLVPMAKTSPTP